MSVKGRDGARFADQIDVDMREKENSSLTPGFGLRGKDGGRV